MKTAPPDRAHRARRGTQRTAPVLIDTHPADGLGEQEGGAIRNPFKGVGTKISGIASDVKTKTIKTKRDVEFKIKVYKLNKLLEILNGINATDNAAIYDKLPADMKGYIGSNINEFITATKNIIIEIKDPDTVYSYLENNVLYNNVDTYISNLNQAIENVKYESLLEKNKSFSFEFINNLDENDKNISPKDKAIIKTIKNIYQTYKTTPDTNPKKRYTLQQDLRGLVEKYASLIASVTTSINKDAVEKLKVDKAILVINKAANIINSKMEPVILKIQDDLRETQHSYVTILKDVQLLNADIKKNGATPEKTEKLNELIAQSLKEKDIIIKHNKNLNEATANKDSLNQIIEGSTGSNVSFLTNLKLARSTIVPSTLNVTQKAFTASGESIKKAWDGAMQTLDTSLAEAVNYPGAAQIIAYLDGAKFSNSNDFQAQALALYILALQNTPTPAETSKPASEVPASGVATKSVGGATDPDAAPTPAPTPVPEAAPETAPVAKKPTITAADAQVIMEFSNYIVENKMKIPEDPIRLPTSPNGPSASYATWLALYESFKRTRGVFSATLKAKGAQFANAISGAFTISLDNANTQKKLEDINKSLKEMDNFAEQFFPTRTRKFQKIYESEATEKEYKDFEKAYDAKNREHLRDQTLLSNVPKALLSLKMRMPTAISVGAPSTGKDAFADGVITPLNGMLSEYGTTLTYTPPTTTQTGGERAAPGSSPLMPVLSALIAETHAKPAGGPTGVAPGADDAVAEAMRKNLDSQLEPSELSLHILKSALLSAFRSHLSPAAFATFTEKLQLESLENAELTAHAIQAAMTSAAAATLVAEQSAAVQEGIQKALAEATALIDTLREQQNLAVDSDLATQNLQLANVYQAIQVSKLATDIKTILADAVASAQTAAQNATAAQEGLNAAEADAALSRVLTDEVTLNATQAALQSSLAYFATRDQAIRDGIDRDNTSYAATRSSLLAALGTVATRDEMKGLKAELNGLSGAVTANMAQFNTDYTTKMATVQAEQAKIAAESSNMAQQYAKLQGVLDSLNTSLGNTALRGGAPADPAAPSIETFREYRKQLDQVKRDIRDVSNTLRGIQGSYNSFIQNIAFQKFIDARDKATDDRSRADADNKITGIYTYLGEEGKGFVTKITEQLNEKKKLLVSIQDRVQKILDTEPTNKMFQGYAFKLKQALEGDYEKSDQSFGILAEIDTQLGGLKTDYDNAFNEVKKIAIGIDAARKEREKQLAAQADALRRTGVSVNTSQAELASRNAEKLKADIQKIINETEEVQRNANTKLKEITEFISAAEAALATAAAAPVPAAAAPAPVSTNRGAPTPETQEPIDASDAEAKAAKEKADAEAKAVEAAKSAAAAAAEQIAKIKAKIEKFKTDETAFQDEKAKFNGSPSDLSSLYATIADISRKLKEDDVAFTESLTYLKNVKSNPEAAKKQAEAEAAKKAFTETKGAYETLADEIDAKVLKEIVLPLDYLYRHKLDPVASLSSSAMGEPGLLSRIYNQYTERRQEYNQNPMIAATELTESLRSNNMLPREVLKVSPIDKTIFIFITLFIRMISLSIVGYMIEKGTIKGIQWGLAAFLLIYIGFFVGFVLLVNLDTYRLRIVFNYINFHANSANVYSHLISLVIFSILIFIIMWNVNFPVPGIKIVAITDEEKALLTYRLEVLTMIVWLFLSIIVIVM